MATRNNLKFISRLPALDDPRLTVSRQDISGGVNDRMHATKIAPKQVESLTNADVGIPGKSVKRPGITQVEDLGNNAGTGAFGFYPDGYIDELLVTHGAKLEGISNPDSGTFTEHKTNFSSGYQTKILKVYESDQSDVALISNGQDNVFRMTPGNSFQDLGDTNTSPPKTMVMCYFRNRVWMLKDGNLYYSDAAPSDYSAAFDRNLNVYRLPVGSEISLIPIRDAGIVIVGSDEVWVLNPSMTPAATDKPEKLLNMGGVATKSFVQVGDDIIGLFKDGIRGIFRTKEDKLQLGRTEPLSYLLKDEYDTINWNAVSKATAVWFDNKYFLALPVDGSTYNNEVWIYYPSLQAWTVVSNWEVGDWAKFTVNGEERLYYIESNDGAVHRAWYGDDDNGTAITYTEIGRKETLGQPLIRKRGGEVFIKAVATGGTLDIYAQFDSGGYNKLGSISLTGNLITFSVTFPVSFLDPNIVYEKFPISSYGRWYNIQLKLTQDDTDDLEILERTVIARPEEYIPKEED